MEKVDKVLHICSFDNNPSIGVLRFKECLINFEEINQVLNKFCNHINLALCVLKHGNVKKYCGLELHVCSVFFGLHSGKQCAIKLILFCDSL